MKIKTMEERLREIGITLDALVEAGMEMYICDPEIGNHDAVAGLLREEILHSFNDINICAIIIAGIRLEEEGREGLIPGLSKEGYQKDPVHLIADEILGIQLATYIAGTRALFARTR